MSIKVVNCANEPYDVYIGRPSIFGNPFLEGVDGTRNEVIKKYKDWILFHDDAQEVRNNLYKLESKTLGCWCKPKKCHGDILAEIVENDLLSVLDYK